jgi:hypothetical protein
LLFPLVTAAALATLHSVIMSGVSTDEYGVPIPALVIWAIVDFPISWILIILHPAFTDAQLLAAGSAQWGLWGFLLGRGLWTGIKLIRSQEEQGSKPPTEDVGPRDGK